MKSFEIIGEGVSLDVDPGSKLITEFVATTFNESSVFAGPFSYPLTFPATAKNVDFFGHAHHLENRAARSSKEVQVVLFGVTWKTAVLDYSIRGDKYVGHLRIDNGTVANWLRDTKLPDVFSGGNNGNLIFKSVSLGESIGEVEDNMMASNSYSSGKPYCWPLLINPYISGEEQGPGSNAYYINHFGNLMAVDNARLFTPMFYWVWLIKEVCSWLGYTAKGSYLDDPFVQTLIVYNTGVRTGLDWKTSRKINIAQHLPSISVSELFKAIRNDHRVMIYFDSLSKTVRFEKSNIILGENERLDLKKHIHYQSLEIEPMTDTAYKLITKTDESDQLYASVPYEKSAMVGFDVSTWKEVPLSIGRVFMQRNSHFSFDGVVCPYAHQIGNIYSQEYEDNEQVYNSGNIISKNPFALRLLSYKGLQEINISPLYRVPFATSEKDGNLGVSYSQTLDQGGSGGLIYSYSMPWYRFICASERVTFKSEMTATQFFNMDPLRKIELCGTNQAPVEALLDKIVFEPRSGSTIVAKAICYPNFSSIGESLKVLVGSSTIENEDGTVYAKMYMRTKRNQSEGNNTVTIQDIWFEFFADPGGLIPKDVKNLDFEIIRQKRRDADLSTVLDYVEIPIVANGVRHEAGEFKSSERVRGPIYDSYYYSYNIIPKSGLVSLGDYKWQGTIGWQPEVS